MNDLNQNNDLMEYSGKDRREEIRYYCSVPVEVWVEEGNVAAVLNDCRMIDISATGMRITTTTDFSPVPIGLFMGQVFRAAVLFQEIGVLTAWARPVWVQKKDKEYEMGLVILRMEKDSRDIHQKILEHLHRLESTAGRDQYVIKLKTTVTNLLRKRKLTAAVGIVVIIIVLLMLLSCGPTPELDKNLRVAQTLSDDNELKNNMAAARAYQFVIKTIGDATRSNAFLQKRIAKRLIETESFTLAREYLDAAAALQPLDAETYFLLGLVYINLAKADETRLSAARNAYQQAIKLKSDYYDALYGLSVVSLEENNPAETRELLRQVLAIKPDYIPALKMTGNLAYEEGDDLAAIAAYETALKHMPEKSRDAFDVCRTLGIIYTRAGDKPGARRYYNRALQLVKTDRDIEDALKALE